MAVSLAWGERKQLMRLTGLPDEILNATRMSRDETGLPALEGEIDGLMARCTHF